MSFKDQTIWITGASSGIGKALAIRFLREGAYVILSGRKVNQLTDVSEISKEHSLVLPFDTTDFDSLPDKVETAWNWRSGVDMLINNAGVSQRSFALDTKFEVYRQLIEIDYLAPVALTQLILPKMTARKKGHLAVVSSVAGKVGPPLRSGYSGAKHAIIGYFDCIRAELEEFFNIHVSTILPGSVRTNIAINSFAGDGSSRGKSDTNIENGMELDHAIDLIMDGLRNKRREINVSDGVELAAQNLRASDPEKLFKVTATEGFRLSQLRESEGPKVSMDPGDVRNFKV
ncbi:SDR family NAD(P)-dependent oxidoreductase [Leptospira sp. GIMC2001]|uniref:SDR family NAD(P)-dependent oxidoreductase n=1 Tax=Leptospira sp. GIMC2001 TaxID=1513297 RepID=UPI00234B33B3|nr:SDR family NAD(P)-dependent oxidoreductase [Leptospira sp. GIMC2001]WCL49632.1 SDR family NAD(P)-dependent oxidoreductase [Leptospira sp. GIMC2001]